MSRRIALLIATMIFAFYALCMVGFLIINQPAPCATETACPDGRLCPAHWLCCEQGCCAPVTLPSQRDDEPVKEYGYPWYAQWPVLFLLGTLGGILFCCIWCLLYRRHNHGVFMCSFACCVRRPASERDSAGSVYPPPRYSRCSSFHQPPPPYSEVTSKPDMYPLVITCGENDGKSSGNYLTLHCFRNYVIRPGSLSATSTAESLTSSFICNAANEANSIIPPPYSCASNYEECGAVGCRSLLRSLSSLAEPRSTFLQTSVSNTPIPSMPVYPPLRPRNTSEPASSTHRDPPTAFRDNLITSPVQPLDTTYDLELELIDCELYCDGDCKPRLGSSPEHHSPSNTEDIIYDHEACGLQNLFACPSPEIAGACESPPQPTSPTQTSRDSTLRRPSDERRHRRLDSAKKTLKTRKSSLYMPLSVAYPVRTSRISPGARASSRSAPATPCSSLVPNLLNFTQRVSASRHSSKSSRLEEERDPLLTDMEPRTDHKF